MPRIGNRRAWLLIVVVAVVVLLASLSARGETVVFQGAALTGGAGVASDRDAVSLSGLGQRVCDDFTLGADARAVTDIEWAGLYGVLGESAHAATFSPDDEFTIAFYDDAGGVPGNIVAEYHPGRVPRLSLADGGWSYRYTLPSPLYFEPGRTYHLAISNNISDNAYWCWSQDAGAGVNHSAPTGSSQWVRWPGDCAFRLSYSVPPPSQASVGLPLLLAGLAGVGVLGLHRYVL